MVPNNAVQPRWFIFWSRLVYLAIALLVLGVLYALPALITPTGQAQVSVIGTTLFGIIIILFLAGSVLGAITLIYGLAANALFLRTHNVLMAVPWRRVTRPLVAVASLFIVLIMMIQFGALPMLGSPEYKTIVTGLNICSYQFRVAAFVDQDGNGIRDPNEAGLPGVNITVSYPDPQPGISSDTNKSSSAVSNSSGLAQVYVSYNPCPTTGTQFGSVVINVETPAGYKATTETTFGPLSIKWPKSSKVQTVYVGFAK